MRNHHGFISAVLGIFNPNLKLTTTLPQKIKKEPYIPTDEEIRKILDCAKDTEYEIPVLLACYGMRRSEICALTLEDIDGDTISFTVNYFGERVKGIFKDKTFTPDISMRKKPP